jgi:long-chain acyl-CoA synthetase
MKSVYEERPWLKSYPSGVPADIKIPMRSINEVFDEVTKKWRDKTAIVFYGKKIGYQELRDKVDRFANALSQIGVMKGDRVAFLLLNSPEHIIAFYGVLKVGATITSISPVYVSSEIRHQLIDSGAQTLICQDMLYEGVEKTGIKLQNVILTNISESLPWIKKTFGKSIVREVYQKMSIPSAKTLEREGFHQFQDLINKHSPNPPRVDINPKEDIALLPYTGGTTGMPKGVMLTHHNVIADLIQYRAFYPFLEDGKEVFAGYMPFYHGAGQVIVLLDGILHGNTVVTITTPDLDEILKVIEGYQVSAILGAPTMYELLKDYKKTNRVNWKRLKIIMSGSDALHVATARDWLDRTEVILHDSYGLTECTAITHGTPRGKPKEGSIGIPLPNVVAAIIDPDRDEFLPLGELGELVIRRTDIVTKGYWNNQEATRESEAIIDGVEWWRTGDIARMDEDGNFYIYDRKRDLIKYKGLRVFAREVEEVLKSHPLIKEVGVIGVPDIKVGENVKAMVVLESDARGKLSEAELIEFCKDKLAHYKIPKIIEFVGEIPKTDVGKVSRRELREVED